LCYIFIAEKTGVIFHEKQRICQLSHNFFAANRIYGVQLLTKHKIWCIIKLKYKLRLPLPVITTVSGLTTDRFAGLFLFSGVCVDGFGWKWVDILTTGVQSAFFCENGRRNGGLWSKKRISGK